MYLFKGIDMTLRDQRALVLAFTASLLAMSVALTAQYALEWRPCELCLIERIPVILAGVAAACGFYPYCPAIVRQILIVGAGLFFIAAGFLSLYHVGVEQHWWVYGGGCSRDPAMMEGVIDYAQALSKPALVRCDQPVWSWHGLTLAGLNVVYSALVGGGTFFLFIKDRNE
jgi:disulfide bond formation protein DsbB